jgi:4'-phosphopantetheinyl transferase
MDPLTVSHAGLIQQFDLQIAPATPSLSVGQVHVWRARLDVEAARAQQLAQWLSGDEHLRAERFRFERDRQRYIISRGILRDILARYLRVNPHDVEIGHTTQGKPYVSGDLASRLIRFNLAHSQDLALYAFTAGHEIGVDLEHLRSIPEMSAIVSHYFSAHEQAALAALPESAQRSAFFNCWTRKEAYVKALGSGLYQSLQEFDVSLVPGEPAALLAHHLRPSEVMRWSVQELFPDDDCAAALVVEGPVLGLGCWTYRPKDLAAQD